MRTDVKLGKQNVKIDIRTLMLSKYLAAVALPAPMTACAWSPKVTAPWGAMGNLDVGDCTIAGAGHEIMLWTANAATIIVPSDADILAAYSAVSGYNPADPSTDQGAVMLDVLKYWRSTGIAGHQIGAFAAVQYWNRAEVMTAAQLFGGLYVGVELPLCVQGADAWNVPSGGGNNPSAIPGSWGGHCICQADFDQDGVTVISWGEKIAASWDFWMAYVTECYAIISQDFISAGVSASGFDLATLQQDLAAVTA